MEHTRARPYSRLIFSDIPDTQSFSAIIATSPISKPVDSVIQEGIFQHLLVQFLAQDPYKTTKGYVLRLITIPVVKATRSLTLHISRDVFDKVTKQCVLSHHLLLSFAAGNGGFQHCENTYYLSTHSFTLLWARKERAFDAMYLPNSARSSAQRFFDLLSQHKGRKMGALTPGIIGALVEWEAVQSISNQVFEEVHAHYDGRFLGRIPNEVQQQATELAHHQAGLGLCLERLQCLEGIIAELFRVSAALDSHHPFELLGDKSDILRLLETKVKEEIRRILTCRDTCDRLTSLCLVHATALPNLI